ncbi:hypothetical protein G6R40_08155 [Chryseobacterium sp. POL2]|uniref:DUF6090 family protein n=1 Tax=Chryseobacterium sp. POL2 TaxID=2713414 RepID=UPI0013E15541|nr:DUF6090 family protein [Chryseobacterium sp. POL2]QIG89639.1 hypothetical protein G6R40_08155 [Chryseobacterium sp. POL2]
MAELEVAKSTKKIYETAKSEEHKAGHKIKEIAMEIVIIIFAVSVSIAFHAWNEDRVEQLEVKHFLLGLKVDLNKDIKELSTDMEAYKKQKRFFSYVANIPAGSLASQDSIDANKDYLFNFTGFTGNQGRYQGFKSSGKIGFIEHDELQNAILDLYEEDIPLLVTSTDFYKAQKLKYADYIFDHSVDFPKGNFLKIISSEPIKNRSKIYLSGVDHIINNYQTCITQMQGVITMIDKEYKH